MHYRPVNVKELQQAELAIVKSIQEESFSREIKMLRSMARDDSDTGEQAKQRKKTIKKASSLYRLNLFLDDHGILRVGGRLTRSDVP